jgi:hypothetical protein
MHSNNLRIAGEFLFSGFFIGDLTFLLYLCRYGKKGVKIGTRDTLQLMRSEAGRTSGNAHYKMPEMQHPFNNHSSAR